MSKEEKQSSSAYKHSQKSVQRPDVGVEAQFPNKKAPKTYRYDSSLAPELCWDENAERPFAEWLLHLITEAAEKGEDVVFSEPQIWKGGPRPLPNPSPVKGEGLSHPSPLVGEGQGERGERFASIAQCAARLRSLTRPFLNWAGKAERQQISVPTLPLFVHERHSTQAILETLQSHKAAGAQMDLFGDPQMDIADKLDAYQHKGPWTNRLVLGDSLQVMNSLLEYEGLGGQVQMIYFDPPYGVKFGSNFQPFVRKRDVTHGKDDEMIREPEMVKAYRDTWELGLHSYLTYLRDRFLLARELLAESGSVFVQIGPDNAHYLREILDEIFGEQNKVAHIVFVKTTSSTRDFLSATADHLLFYAKNAELLKYNQVYLKKAFGGKGGSGYTRVELPDGSRRSLTKEERENAESLPAGSKLYCLDNLTSQSMGREKGEGAACWFPIYFGEKKYYPNERSRWKTNENGMEALQKENRIEPGGARVGYVRYWDDFPYFPIGDIWDDVMPSFMADKAYVVQTATSVIERCLLMATSPGDLVLDITCGSGTTAYVAEQWGRRWITCDTSRVPLALARQRLLTATFPWYQLKNPSQGPAGGFVYQRKQNRKGEEVGGLVPRITLKSIANNEEPEMVTLVDRPEVNNKITRVCGPFTVEATIQAAMSLDENNVGWVSPELSAAKAQGVTHHSDAQRWVTAHGHAGAGSQAGVRAPNPPYENPRRYLDRMIEVLRQSKTLRLPGNVSLELETVRPLADREYLHAEATAKNGSEKPIAIVFGPEDGAIGSEYVFNAHTEALQQGFQQLFLFGFAIQAKAREMLDKLKIPTTYVAMTPDVVMSDLLKTSRSSEIFSITGLPDVALEPAGHKPDGTPLHQVEVRGLDIFRPDTMETDSIEAENLPCWMLDTNYNGMVFCAAQVFFPKTGAWDNLQKSLKGDFNDSVWEHLAGTVSEPFALGGNRRIAVKVIDDRGNELMVVKALS